MGSSQAWLVEDLAAATADGENGILDSPDHCTCSKRQRQGQACAGFGVSFGIARQGRRRSSFVSHACENIRIKEATPGGEPWNVFSHRCGRTVVGMKWTTISHPPIPAKTAPEVLECELSHSWPGPLLAATGRDARQVWIAVKSRKDTEALLMDVNNGEG